MPGLAGPSGRGEVVGLSAAELLVRRAPSVKAGQVVQMVVVEAAATTVEGAVLEAFAAPAAEVEVGVDSSAPTPRLGSPMRQPLSPDETAQTTLRTDW